MTRFWTIGRGIALTAVIMSMSTTTGTAAADLRDALERHVYHGPNGDELPYRLFVPKGYDAAQRYPLIVFLHGAGERGIDNQAQLAHPEVLRFARDDAQRQHPCFILAPQCPKDCRWVEVPWSDPQPHRTPAEPSRPMRLLLGLLDGLDGQYRLDPRRHYVTGMSMGGFGTLDLVVRRPGYWAAAVPICGGADDARAAQIKSVPMWIFHGAADTTVPTARSRSLVQALQAAGAQPRYTEYPGIGHNAWSKAYNEPELVEWLFSQKRDY